MAGSPASSSIGGGGKKSHRKTAKRITRKDIKTAGDQLPALIKTLVKRCIEGDAESRTQAASGLAQVAQMDHGSHATTLFKNGAVKPLVALLAGGDAVAQSHAAAALAGIAINKADHQRAIVEKGGVEPLVALLKTGSANVQGEAAAALATLDADVSHQQGIIKAGAIPPLGGLLKNGSAAAQASAAQATANAARYSGEAQKLIAKAGSIPLLLTLLGVGKAQKPAAQALAMLASNNAAIQTEISEAGGIAPLLALLNGLDVDVQVQAAAALREMARDNVETQNAIAKSGGIGPLLALLTSSGKGSTAAQSNGMAALAQLARNNRENQDAIAKQAGIKPLVQLLESSDDDAEVLSSAACAVMEITSRNFANQRTVVDNGGISQLANILKSSSNLGVKAEVAGALWALAEDPEIKVSIAGASTIMPLVELLGSSETRAQEHANLALGSLGLNNTDNQVQITQMLIELLTNGTEAAQERAARALWGLREANPNAHEAIARAGNPEKLVELLKHGIPDAKDYALWSLSLSISTDNQSTVAESGGVQPLIDQLGDARTVNQEQAAAAIAKLAHDNEETRAAVTKLAGVKPLIGLLEASGSAASEVGAASEAGASSGRGVSSGGGTSSETALQNAADALANLAVDPAARDEIVASGGIDPLVALLTDQGPSTKKYAASALARLSKDHEATQLAVAAAGAIVPLVALLDGNEGPDAQEASAGAILELASHKENRMTITESGGIGWLVMLLGSNNQRAREHAEGALVKLSIENANRVLIIKKLVAMLQETGATKDGEAKDGDASLHGGREDAAASAASAASAAKAQEQAAAALVNLARESEDNRKSIVEANGILPLLELLDSASSKAKENAVGAIKELCRNSKNNQSMIAKAGGIAKLVGVLAGFSPNTMKENTLIQLITLAASAIKEMAKDNRKNQDAITDAGAIMPLVAMLTAPAPEMQANAAGALANLAHNHAENQGAIARTGAVAPLCGLMKEGSEETKDESAKAIWSLSIDHQGNKDTIAKLGGIDPLLGLLVTGSTEKSQEYVAGALAALVSKHQDNRQVIAKRLVGLLGSSAVRTPDRAERVLMTCASFTSDSAANQIAIAKLGGIPPLIAWLSKDALANLPNDAKSSMLARRVQSQAARAMLCLAADNATTQMLMAKSDGIPPLIGLVKKSSPEAQEFAASALWHMGTIPENRVTIVEAGGIKPLISMLGAEKDAPELAAIILVRLARGNPDVSIEIAEKGGVLPLVKLVAGGTPGSQMMGASVLSELALVPKNRDIIANEGGIEPIIKLLSSNAAGTPEVAARVLAHLSHEEPSRKNPDFPDDPEPAATPREDGDASMKGSAERRARIHISGGISRLITMLEEKGGHKEEQLKSLGFKDDATFKVGTKEQAAITLADIAHDNHDMQDVIIHSGGVPPLLAFTRMGSQLGQEHAARAIWHLAALTESQGELVGCGAIPDLVQLLKTGSPKAQEMAAAGMSDLALGAVVEIQAQRAAMQQRREKVKEPAALLAPSAAGRPSHDDIDENERVRRASVSIARRNSISLDGTEISGDPVAAAAQAQAQAAVLASADPLAAADPSSSSSSSPDKSPDLSPASARGKLAVGGTEGPALHRRAGIDSSSGGQTISQSAPLSVLAPAMAESLSGEPPSGGSSPSSPPVKQYNRLVAMMEAGGIMPLVALLTNGTIQARENAAGALWHLALEEINQATIAKANGIAPLVTILDDGTERAHKHAADALARLAIKNPDNQAQIAKHCVALLGNQSTGAQQRSAQVLRDLAAAEKDSPVVIVNAGAISPLVTLLTSGAPEVKEEASSALSTLSFNSPSTQLAIASGLVVLVGSGSAEAQEHVTQLLLRLAHDTDNCVAIAKAGAIARLVVQLRGGGRTSVKGQELAAAVLSHLSTLDDCIKGIAAANGIRPLVMMLTTGTPPAQAYAATVLANMARASRDNQKKITSEGGITPLVTLLSKENRIKAKAEAASALLCLSQGQPVTQKAVADAGAIKPLVALLNEEDDHARKKAAGAIASLAESSPENQDAVEKNKGLGKLVGLLKPTMNDEVSAEAAAALAVLARDHSKNQDKVAAANGIEPLVALLASKAAGTHAKEEAASALWSLSSKHYQNQEAIAEAGGIARLVAVLSLGSERAQEQAAGALASLALDNTKNELSIAKLLVSFLETEHQADSAKAARAISRLARAHASNQRSIAMAGGIKLLVGKLNMHEGGVGVDVKSLTGAAAVKAFEMATVQKEMASAIWSMGIDHGENQVAIAAADGIPPLISLLGGHPEVQRDAAGALWSLAANAENQTTIASAGGVEPLVELLANGSLGAQETAAGALFALAETSDNRVSIAHAGGIPLLVALFDGGSEEAKKQAAGALQALVLRNAANQLAVVNEAVAMLRSGSPQAQEHVTQLLRNLAQDPENRNAIAKAGAVPELVRQLETGSEKAMGMAASGLALIALKSAEHRATVTNELVKLLGSNKEAVRQRASEALTDMAADESSGAKKGGHGGAVNGVPLVNLLKDGLKDGRVEAQEYALRSLLAISDTAAKEAIVEAGCIKPLISALSGGKLSAVAEEHAAAVLSGLAPIGNNANAIKDNKGIDPLVVLLSTGTAEAKAVAAAALAQLARRANAANQIAEAGAVHAFVQWLVDPTLGPPEVAARALSEIALDNQDTQTQIAEEGAILPLVSMVGAWVNATATDAPAAQAPKSAEVKSAKEPPGALQRMDTTSLFGRKTGRRSSSVARASKESDAPSDAPAAVPAPAAVQGLAGVPVPAPAPSSAVVADVAAAPDGTDALPMADTPSAAGDSLAPAAETPAPAAEPVEIAPAAAAAEVDAQTPVKRQPAATFAVPAAAPDAASPDGSSVAADGSPAVEMQPVDPGLSAAAEAARARAAKKAVAVAIKVANVAAGSLATLAKDNVINMLTITEEGGIQPLVDLLKTKAPSYENPTKALWHLAASEDNQMAIARAGGIAPLVALLMSDSEVTAQYAAAALCSLARDNTENQVALAKAGAIAPLVELLGSDSSDTQEQAVGALLYLASHDIASRNAVVERLVALLDVRNAAAQMKSAEALAVLAARSDDNRKAITAASAIVPLVRLLGDGRRTRKDTPQERAAAVLADLSRSGDNKKKIVEAGGINPLVAMLSSDSPEVQAHAAGALWQLAALGNNKGPIADAGAIPPLVAMLRSEVPEAQAHATGALWHLASSADNKVSMVTAGVIPLIIPVLESRLAEARQHAAAVVSALARTQGGNKKAIYNAGGIKPLTALLSDKKAVTQRHAACALWGLSDGKDGVYDQQIAEAGAIPRLIAMLQYDDSETRGFAVACMVCLCKDPAAHSAILEAGGAELLQALAYGPATWLRGQAIEMLTLLGLDIPDSDDAPPIHLKMPSVEVGEKATMRADKGTTRTARGSHHAAPTEATMRSARGAGGSVDDHNTSRTSGFGTARPLTARMKFHFFSFQIHGTTGFTGHA